MDLKTHAFSTALVQNDGSFAYFTTRKEANRQLGILKIFKHRLDGEFYILDEVYGE